MAARPASAPAAATAAARPAAAAAAPVAAATPRKKPWLLIGIAGAVLLICGGTGAWLMLGHGTPKKATAAAAPTPPSGPPLYLPLDPPFVANFDGDQQVRFLQVTAQIMTHDAKTLEALKAADPIIRNDLLMLFSGQKATELATNDGKEKLRAQALGAVRKVLAANDGKPDKVDAVLFTTFVMQ